MAREGGCCPAEGGLVNDWDNDIDPADPTLSSCCRRDFMEQRQIQKAREALMSVDRIDARRKAERGVLLIPSVVSNFSDVDSDGSDQEEPILQEIRDQRLQQLRKDSNVVGAPSTAGHIRQLTEAQAMNGLREQDGVTVLHLAEHGSAAGQDLDEHLETLAFRNTATCFWRVPLTRTSYLPPMLGLPHAPALLIFKEGVATAKVLVAQFVQDGTLLEEKVSQWMIHAGATMEAAQSEGDDAGSEAEEGDWREPCEICGRRYYHQHINSKAVYKEGRRKEHASDDD